MHWCVGLQQRQHSIHSSIGMGALDHRKTGGSAATGSHQGQPSLQGLCAGVARFAFMVDPLLLPAARNTLLLLLLLLLLFASCCCCCT